MVARLARLGWSVVVAAAGVACANPGSQGAGAEGIQARGRNCVFEERSARPGPEYIEVARISVEGEGDFGAGKYRNTRDARKVLRETVCELGGDVVTTEVDVSGFVVRAIVFQRVREPHAPRDQARGPASPAKK